MCHVSCHVSEQSYILTGITIFHESMLSRRLSERCQENGDGMCSKTLATVGEETKAKINSLFLPGGIGVREDDQVQVGRLAGVSTQLSSMNKLS